MQVWDVASHDGAVVTRAAVTAIARRHKLDGRGTDALIEEYNERMAIAIVEGGQGDSDADRIAMLDVEHWAPTLARKR